MVVLISGGGDTLDTWAPIASHLAQSGQVIAVNRPGFGASDPLDDYTGANIIHLVGLQTELAELGAPGEYRYVPDSSHYIHRDQPDSVIAAVLQLWA